MSTLTGTSANDAFIGGLADDALNGSESDHHLYGIRGSNAGESSDMLRSTVVYTYF